MKIITLKLRNLAGCAHVRWIVCTATVILVSCLMMNAFGVNQPLHYQLASDTRLKGKGKDGYCMDYALALSSKLADQGIHGRLIFYKWRIKNSDITGNHVLVMYRLVDQTEWVVDNEIPHPKQAPIDASPIQLIFLLSDTQTDPVDVELQENLNQLSYF